MKTRQLVYRDLCLLFACVLPLLGALSYFYWAPDREDMRVLYGLTKGLQFLLPVLIWGFSKPGLLPKMTELFRFSLRTPAQRRGLAYGLLSAWLLLIVGFFAYNSAFRGVIDTPGVRAALEGKLRDFGVYSVTDFIVLSFFIAVIHSLLEEYFWRFYVCAEMERIFSARWSGAKLQLLAILASSLAFTLHHIVVITHYAQVEQNRLLIIALASFVVFACGALWASLYMRYRNVYVIWISHIAADLVMLGMGYDVIYR